MKTILVMALALLATTGCKKHLDTEKGESVIHDGLKEMGVDVKLTCPRDVKLAKGVTFDCTGTTAAGEAVKVTVEQTDDVGNVSWLLDGQIANETMLSKEITTQVGAPASVSCPKKILHAKQTVECDVAAKGTTAKLYVTADADGKGLTWNTKPPTP